MDSRFIRPAQGRKIRHPDQGYAVIPEEGTLVAWSSYWERALTEGDIVIVDAPKTKKGGEA